MFRIKNKKERQTPLLKLNLCWRCAKITTYIDYHCDHRKHGFEELLNGWNFACKAFPEGAPPQMLEYGVFS
ncbi:hypothetical protein FACS1894187_04790 [Synergistales bacterium]|nr:hypothetical protein FACS1894187_04790 [Synergistales bacterium]